jgi:phosphoenolpyruvate carboxykinase (GTP)
LNWFRKDAKGNYLWPNFGENLRILNWIGRVPYYKDLAWNGLYFPRESFESLHSIATV